MEEKRSIILRSYSKVWKIEKRLEHLNGIRVNSISLTYVAYVFACLVILFILLTLIPPLRKGSVFLMGAFVFGVPVFLMKVKLDGKSPLQFFGSLLTFYAGPKTYIRFRKENEDAAIRIKEAIGFRRDKVVRQT